MKKKYSTELKAKIVMEILREDTLNQIAAKHGIHPNQLARWRKTVVEGMGELLADKRKKGVEAKEQEMLIQELYTQIGEMSAKMSWLKKNLELSFSKCERMAMIREDDDYNIREQCEMLSINRSSFYYSPKEVSPHKLEILNKIDEIYTEFPLLWIKAYNCDSKSRRL